VDGAEGSGTLSRRLTRRERGLVTGAALSPVVVAVVILTPIAVVTGASPAEVVAAALVYGGLLGLAGGVVAVDRLQARQCPRCWTRRSRRREPHCAGCGYDLVAQPRYACSEACELSLEPGLCSCGRRLQELDPARGVGPQIGAMVRIGGWLLVVLLLVGAGLRLLDG
jgi:hypothetical protein